MASTDNSLIVYSFKLMMVKYVVSLCGYGGCKISCLLGVRARTTKQAR